MPDNSTWELVPYQELGAERWDDKIAQYSPSPYHSSWWLELLAHQLPNSQNTSVAFQSTDNEWAFFPSITFEKFGFRKTFSLPYTPGGLLGNPHEEVVRLIHENIVRRADAFQIMAEDREHPLLGGIGTPFYGVDVDLRVSQDDLMSSFSKSLRRDIRQKRDQLRISEVQTSETMDAVVKLYQSRMESLGSAGTHSAQVLHALFALPEESRRISVAECEGRTISANISLMFHKKSVYFLNASSEDFKKYEPNKKLLWEDICWAQRLGAENYYLGGAVDGSQDDDLYRYKERWGNECVHYVRNQRLSTRGWIIDKAQSLAKNRWFKPLFRIAGIR